MKDAPLMASCMLGMHSPMLSLVMSNTGTREKFDVILNTNCGHRHSAPARSLVVTNFCYCQKLPEKTN